MKIRVINQPNERELHNLFERAFSETLEDKTEYFKGDLNQNTLSDWFDFGEMIKQLPYGSLVEARDEKGTLIGAAFIAKQHPISWLDGHKAELFIIAILPGQEQKGLGSQLLTTCESEAKKMGAASVIVNAHSMQPQLHKFYEKNGYQKMGELSNFYANGNAIFFSKKI